MIMPVIAQIMFSIQSAQEGVLKMIIKGFATIALVIRIDNMFAGGFPAELK